MCNNTKQNRFCMATTGLNWAIHKRNTYSLTRKVKHTLTLKAFLLCLVNLFSRQCCTVHLNAEKSSAKVSPIAYSSSKSHREVCRKTDLSYLLPCHQFRVDPQGTNSSPLVIRCSHVVPRFISHFTTS